MPMKRSLPPPTILPCLATKNPITLRADRRTIPPSRRFGPPRSRSARPGSAHPSDRDRSIKDRCHTARKTRSLTQQPAPGSQNLTSMKICATGGAILLIIYICEMQIDVTPRAREPMMSATFNPYFIVLAQSRQQHPSILQSRRSALLAGLRSLKAELDCKLPTEASSMLLKVLSDTFHAAAIHSGGSRTSGDSLLKTDRTKPSASKKIGFMHDCNSCKVPSPTGPSGDESQVLRGIAKRRKRSAARRLSGGRSASCTVEAGEPIWGTLVEGSASSQEPWEGSMPRTSSLERVSSRQRGIAMVANS